jgi:hypothetical protein
MLTGHVVLSGEKSSTMVREPPFYHECHDRLTLFYQMGSNAVRIDLQLQSCTT